MSKAFDAIDIAARQGGLDAIYIQHLRNFGDVLHSSMVVRHYRAAFPKKRIIWGISENYVEHFKPFSQKLDVMIFGLPHAGEPGDRVRWANHAKTKFKTVITPSVCPFGWKIAGNIVDNVLYNAGIKNLVVPRCPFFPHTPADEAWANEFLSGHEVPRQFVTLEYNSYTLSRPPHNITWPVVKYNKMLEALRYRTIFIGGPNDPPLTRGIDARGTTWRQAKVLIARSSLFVGCGSGLTVLACCEDIKTKMLEFNVGHSLRANEIYNIKRSRAIKIDDPASAASIINAEVP